MDFKIITGVVQQNTTISFVGWAIIIFFFIMMCFFFWFWQREHYHGIYLQKQLNKELAKRFGKIQPHSLNHQNQPKLKGEVK